MWSVRTAAKHVAVRTCVLRSAAVGTCCTNVELLNNNRDEKYCPTSQPISAIDDPERASATRPFSSSTLFVQSRNLSSHINNKSTGKKSEELEGFSDLDTDTEDKDVDDELVGESDDEEENTLEEEELIKQSSVSERHESPLFGLLLSSPMHTMEESLEKWIKEGHEIQKEDVVAALWRLRRRNLFAKSLKFMNWLEKSEHYEFTDVEYSFLVNLHAKVHGLYRAEKFIEEIPQSMRTERVYLYLLASCVYMSNVPKTEEVFNKMQDLNFPLAAFACNQLLLLYKRYDKKKIADVLLKMKKENVKPTLFTYKMLIDTKGIVGDIQGMEQLLDTMKEDGIEQDLYLRYMVAKHYIKGGHTKKAEKLAKEMEGGDLSGNKFLVRKFLLDIYGGLGMPDEVERIWKACGVKPLMQEWNEVIWAWAKLGKEERLEKVVDEMSKQYTKIPHMCYNSLLGVYVDKKMLDKAKDLVKQMSDEGIIIGPETLHTLVRFYVERGDVVKADSVLQNWVRENHKMQIKPRYYTYVHLLDAYAKKGDYHNAEKVFYLTRQIGYSVRPMMYERLLGAYVNAKVPAYGFRDRLRADNIFPKRILSEQLVAVEPFKKALLSEVLE